MANNIPKALFDTLACIHDPLLACVKNFLDTLSITNAAQDFEISREFLISYAGSNDTFNSYRREVERLLQWSWLIANKSLAQLDRNTMQEYIQFSLAPPLNWISNKTVARFTYDKNGYKIHNNEWRPFVKRISKAQHRQGVNPDTNTYLLSNKSIQALLATLSTYFNYLQQEEYVPTNPISLIRQKNRYLQTQQQLKVTRKLSNLQWSYVINSAIDLANQNSADERMLFMMSAFYLLGLRISELADTPGRTPIMGHFAPDKTGRWWFSTVGKGNKLRDVAVPDEMLEILKRYRKSLGLSALPTRGEQTPLLHKQRSRSGLGTRQIRNLVQRCFNIAIDNLIKAGKEDEAQDLSSATVHWLRHTAISADIEHRPREHVRDDAGHSNAATTEQYIDTDRTARHDSAKHKKLTTADNN